MQHLQAIMRTHPDVGGDTSDRLLMAVDHAARCAQVCIVCADACLAEEDAGAMRQCIRLDLDCADLCGALATLGLRRTGGNERSLRGLLELCADICGRCAAECEKHAGHHEHCRLCAEHCRRCEQACRDALAEVG